MEITINLKPEDIEEILSNYFALKGVNVQDIKFVSHRMYRGDQEIEPQLTKIDVIGFMPALNN